MTSTTDLANRALAHIGEMRISDIDDATSKAARVCKEFVQQVIDENLREHRWNCSIFRATLTQLSAPPGHGFARAYQLPSGLMRLLEVNGEQFGASDEYFEIEGDRQLLTDATAAEIRYVRRIGVGEFDPLLAKAVSYALAAEICIPLTANAQLQAQLVQLQARALSRAKTIDAIEVGSREVRPMARMIGNSPLVQSRSGSLRRNLDPLRFTLP